MEIGEDTRRRIESLIASDRVVLFMKGTPEMPQCGFSAATVAILESLVPKYTTVNVLEDPTLREGIKVYSKWPTIPQLYLDQELLGGCDIVKELFNTGALHEALGLDLPDRNPPNVSVSETAVHMIQAALEQNHGQAVHLTVDARWQHELSLGRAGGHEIVTRCNGVEILMDLATAQRAEGLDIDVTETLEGRALTFDNPNAPAPAR